MNILSEELMDWIVTNLKIISLIQKNEKLCIRKGHLQIDKVSYLRFLKRYYYNDSRESTIIYIKEIIKNIKIIINNNQNNNSSMNHINTQNNFKDIYQLVDIESIEMGINNLKVSYIEDPMMIASLEHLLNKIKQLIIN